ELKSRLMLSGEDEELLDIEPEQAAEELLARMLDAARYRAAAGHLRELLAAAAARAAPPHRAAGGRLGTPGASRRIDRPPADDAADDQPAPHRLAPRQRRRAPRAPARAAPPGRLQLRGGRQRRRPHDGRGDAVRAARALQA